jgi:putative PIN family toxin of toxin-antitoxin system
MRVIFDTNIWVSLLIGKRLSLSQSLFYRPDIEIYYCAELEREYLNVTHRGKIRKYVDEKQIQRVHRLIVSTCHKCQKLIPDNSLIRDQKDLYLLSLAKTVKADVIVTGDADLLDLKQYKETKMVSFAEFRTLL